MWLSSLSRDFEEFTHSFVAETRSLAAAVARLATDAAAPDPPAAGDEDSALARARPLAPAALDALQRSDAVFLHPIQREEEEEEEEEDKGEKATRKEEGKEEEEKKGEEVGAFARWRAESEYGSVKMRAGQSSAAAFRQRVLDESAAVREKFDTFVVAEGRVTEDEFFDRYFFRLMRLRQRTSPAEEKVPFIGRIIDATDEVVRWAQQDSEEVFSEEEEEKGEMDRKEKKHDDRRHIAALENLVRALQREIIAERQRTNAVLDAARTCGLKPQQLKCIETAAEEKVTEKKEEVEENEKVEEKKGEKEEEKDGGKKEISEEESETARDTEAKDVESVHSALLSPNTQVESDEWTKV